MPKPLFSLAKELPDSPFRDLRLPFGLRILRILRARKMCRQEALGELLALTGSKPQSQSHPRLCRVRRRALGQEA